MMATRCEEPGAATESVLLVRTESWFCALPIAEVIETCRPLPLQRVDGVAGFVRGVTVLRGVTTPVIHLGRLLAGGEPKAGCRYVAILLRERQVALEVDEVLGVRSLSRAQLVGATPMIGGALPDRVAAVGVLDGALLAWLEGARLLADDVLDLVLAEGWG